MNMREFFKKHWVWIVVAALFATYAPYLGTRYIRTGGDEKVYVSQALEMARDGHWFIQTLGDKPAYYKGPVHYILVQIGAAVFGRTPWAVLYMNLLFLIAGALAVGAVVKRRLPAWEQGPIWTGISFGLCVGVYAHTFASQMEVELAGTAAVALYLLDRLPVQTAGFLFWIAAGFAGWIKAPLHSAFLGVAALLYWALSGQFMARARNPKAWLAALTGIGVGVAGYLPAYFGDREHFVHDYILREIAQKSSTGQSIWSPINSTYGFYLFPWILLAAVAYVQAVFQMPDYLKNREDRSLLALVSCFCLPSLCFFIYHPYRFENYNLPSISAVWVFLAFVWSRRTRIWEWFYGLGFGILSLVLLAFGAFILVLQNRFAPVPAWWPAWLVPVVCVSVLLAAVLLVRYGILDRGRQPGVLALSAVAVYWALGGFFSVVGQREMVDIRAYLQQADQRGENVTLAYYNLMGNIWSEWGLLNFWVDRPVRGIHDPEQLKAAIERHDTILVPSGEGEEGFRSFIQKEFPEAKFVFTPWKRWQTHGGADTGKPLWREAWDRRDFSVLERNFWIVKVEDLGLPARGGSANSNLRPAH